MTPPTEPLPLPFLQNGIAQVAILVKDLDRAVENYWQKFGIGPWHFYTYGAPLVKHMAYEGQPANYKMRIALSYFGPMRIELVEKIDGTGPNIYEDYFEAHGYGPHHFGLLVDNMEVAIAQAEAAGYRVIMEGSGFGPDGDGHYAYLSTEDDLGAIFELIERPKNRYPPEKIYPPPDDS